ncbi:MAG: dTDP-4-dehydrorhamnose 3,5-epimerase [Alphaproteobacteria bacterium]|nr:MAG: dTDP-4-dehydrorhamnose 3,5-epimerase [Alphaproteobacteria bacterium]
MLEIIDTAIADVKLLRPRRFADERGYFLESWNRARMAEAGFDHDFVQDNHSFSARPGTVRGLHYQAPPHAQAKLVRVACGAIRDVAVDIRRGSPDFGRWIATELSEENGLQMLIPRGFLHGFVTLRPDTHVLYKTDDHYAPECDGAIRFDDPDIGVDWGMDVTQAVLSAKDAAAPGFSGFESPFVYDPG